MMANVHVLYLLWFGIGQVYTFLQSYFTGNGKPCDYSGTNQLILANIGD